MATNENLIPIPGRLHSVATEGHVAGADEIIDDTLQKNQATLNSESAYIDDSESSSAVVPEFDPESQTVHVTAQTLSEAQKEQVRTNIDVYSKGETYSAVQLNNMITTPNQQYVSVTANSQTTSVTDVLPATGAANTVYRVGNWDGSQFDASVYSEYAWNGSQYIFLCVKSQIGEVFDISVYNNNTKYADLAAALNGGANIPQSLQKGGMSVKFVRSSDNNYIRYNLLANSFTTDITQWAINDGGVYIENPEFIEVKTDKDGKLLEVRKIDGTKVEYGDLEIKGNIINSSIQEQFNTKANVADVNIALDTKVDKVTDKSLIPTQYIQEVDNPEFIDVKTDAKGKILEAITIKGKKVQNLPLDTPHIEESYIDNPQYTEVVVDKNNNLLEGFCKENYKEFNYALKINKGLIAEKSTPFNDGLYEYIRKIERYSLNTYKLPETSDILATYDNVIVRFFQENNIEYFTFSKNLGATWSEPIENTIGDIAHTHIFSDGTVLICGRTKCYTIRGDYSAFVESTIYDIDGSIYTPTRDGFYSQMYRDQYFFVDGVEMEIFGEYVLEDSSTPRNELQANIWYSMDKGATLKSAFKSGTTVADNTTITVRHIHYVLYCRQNGKFYVSTGDTPAESYLLEGTYDSTNDIWTWHIIGNGSMYKFGYMWADESFLYLLTDYTSGANPDKKGILRCPLNGLNNIDNYINLYVCPADEWGEIAIVNIFIDTNGIKVLFPDYLGLGVVWVATDGYNFRKVSLNRNELLGFNILGPNQNNEVIVLARGNEIFHKMNAIQYNLTELMRENGINNFMK